VYSSNEILQFVRTKIVEEWIPSWIFDLNNLFLNFGSLTVNHVLPNLKKAIGIKVLRNFLIHHPLIPLDDGVHLNGVLGPSQWWRITFAIIDN